MKKMLLMFVAVLGLSISANAQWGYYDQIYYQNSFQNHMNQYMYYYNQAQQQFSNYMNNVAQQPVYYYSDYNYNLDYITSNSDNCHSSHSNSHSSKDCHICYGSGICQTCGGDGFQSSGLGLGDIPCANCLKVNGNRTGKCSVCRGTGKVN